MVEPLQMPVRKWVVARLLLGVAISTPLTWQKRPAEHLQDLNALRLVLHPVVFKETLRMPLRPPVLLLEYNVIPRMLLLLLVPLHLYAETLRMFLRLARL